MDWKMLIAVAGAIVGALTLIVKFGQAMFRLGERIGRSEERLNHSPPRGD